MTNALVQKIHIYEFFSGSAGHTQDWRKSVFLNEQQLFYSPGPRSKVVNIMQKGYFFETAALSDLASLRHFYESYTCMFMSLYNVS